ncbi:MAG: hypothetical protein ABI760_05445 [Ferruginibacter sp.]
MFQITPPLRLNDQGKQVQNLHFTLFLCLQKSTNPKLTVILDAKQFTEVFKNEAHDQVYGAITSSIVESFQQNPEIPVENIPVPASGEIDKPTAEMFNKLLLQYAGLEMDVPPNYPFDTADPLHPPETTPVTIPFLVFGDTSPAVTDLQMALGKLGFPISSEEMGNGFGNETCNAVKKFKTKYNIPSFGCLVEKQTADALNKYFSQHGIQSFIGFPIYFGMQTAEVRKLHTSLKALIDSGGQNIFLDPFELQDGKFGESTCKIITNLQLQFGINVETCYIDEATANKIGELVVQDEYEVSGMVFTENGLPSGPGINVDAYDIDLQGIDSYDTVTDLKALTSENGFEFLGTGQTNSGSHYSIGFKRERFSKLEQGLADVMVYAFAGNTIIGRTKRPSAKSDFRDNRLPGWDIRLEDKEIISNDKTEFEIAMAAVSPLIPDGRISGISNTERRFNFVSAETGLGLPVIIALGDASRIWELIPESELDILELLYACARALNESTRLSWSVLARNLKIVNKFIHDGIKERKIKIFTDEQIADFIKLVSSFATANLLGVPQDNQPDLQKVLSFAMPVATDQSKLLDLLVQHEGDTPAFWNKALPEAGFSIEAISKLQFTGQLAALSINHLPIIDEVINERKIGSLRDVVLTLQRTDWQQIIEKAGVPVELRNDDKDIENQNKESFIDSIIGALESSHPTLVVEKLIENGDFTHLDDNVKKDLKIFFSAAESFDLRNSHVDDFTKTLDQFDENHRSELKKALKSLQRIFCISPTKEIMVKLLNRGFTSAFRIATMSKEMFINGYSEELGGFENAAVVYEKAAFIYHRNEHLITYLNDFNHLPSSI